MFDICVNFEHGGSTKVGGSAWVGRFSVSYLEKPEKVKRGRASGAIRSDPVPLSSHLRALTGKLIGAAEGMISRCGEIEPTPHEMRKKQVNWLMLR